MLRNVDLNRISDGRLYSSGDMVKADCHDCKGCSACCREMGNSIILDPMDIWRFARFAKLDFRTLISNCYIELNIADGLILPNIRMDEKRDACPFLNENGRCNIHDYRPGLCRLFPLGRFYEEKGFKYFLQIDECKNKNRGKIKIKKLLGIPDLKAYETYIDTWHSLLVKCREGAAELNDSEKNTLMLYLLRSFYETGYYQADEESFYQEFYARVSEMRNRLKFEM